MKAKNLTDAQRRAIQQSMRDLASSYRSKGETFNADTLVNHAMMQYGGAYDLEDGDPDLKKWAQDAMK